MMDITKGTLESEISKALTHWEKNISEEVRYLLNQIYYEI